MKCDSRDKYSKPTTTDGLKPTTTDKDSNPPLQCHSHYIFNMQTTSCGDFQAEIKASFVYLVIFMYFGKPCKLLYPILLYFVAPCTHTWILISLRVWNVSIDWLTNNKTDLINNSLKWQIRKIPKIAIYTLTLRHSRCVCETQSKFFWNISLTIWDRTVIFQEFSNKHVDVMVWN